MQFDAVRADLAAIPLSRSIGRISRLSRGAFAVEGLPDLALGDRVRAKRCDGTVFGEVIGVNETSALVMPEGALEGLRLGDQVTRIGPLSLPVADQWRGRMIDPLGQPLDGRPLFRSATGRDTLCSPLPAAQRRGFGARLSTGLAVFDTLLPLVRGQRLGLFAGSGVGKSTLLAQLARGVAADLVVIALVGERGRELRSFVSSALGTEGMSRTVLVAATSDQSPLLRWRCLPSAVTIAEHFRDRGLQVLLLVDSITRFAEAHREIAVAAGEGAALRGYPPSLAPSLMGLCERAGPGLAQRGNADITAIFTVLVAGSDMEEPIADILRGTLDGHVVLSRDIAERGRYPAVDLLRSVSRSLPAAARQEENLLIQEARRILGAYDRAEMMIQSGLYVGGSDPLLDRAIRIWPQLDGFLAESAPQDGIAGSFARLARILAS